MTRITTGCPQCGRVELELDDVTLVVSPLEDRSWYVFDCLGCAQRVVKPAPTSVALALTSVRTRTWTVPAEELERVGPDDAPVIGVDDLLDALLLLRCHDHLVTMADDDVREGRTACDGWSFEDGVVVDGPGATASSQGEEGTRPAHPNAA